MVTDSTVYSAGTSSRLPKQIARSHGHKLLADGLGQHGARQVHGGHLAGELGSPEAVRLCLDTHEEPLQFAAIMKGANGPFLEAGNWVRALEPQ